MTDGLKLRKVNSEIEKFKTRDITLVPGLSFNQYETIKQIYFYYNSKFQTGDIDDEGDRKYFYNIVKNPCKVFSKAIDFDTKNIRLLTTGGGDPVKTWFMERDLKYWMREQQFGKVLNRIFKELPIYGSVVLKLIDGKPYFVDLRNFVVEQTADTLDDANYIIEVHNFTVEQFRKVAKKMEWDKALVEETIRLFYDMKNTSHIRVYERYGDIAEETKDGMEYSRKRLFLADVGTDEYDQRGELTVKYPGVELGCEDYEGHPYFEFHAEKVGGRWLGVGVVESLFEPQVRQNEIANLQSKTSYWAALRIFQTRDDSVQRNLLSDVANGEVINVDSEITQVDMSDRNLAFFNQESQKWMANRDELTFSYDVVQGERLPAGTPLGSAQLAVSQTLSYFEGIQENVALDIKEMIYREIIPSFKKQNSTEHTLRLVGQDLDQYIEMVKNELVFAEVVRLAVNNGIVVTEMERDAIGMAVEEAIRQEKEKIITIPQSYYKDLKYDIDIDITGESVDTRVRSATRFAILQAIQADPQMLQDPMKRKLLIDMGEDGGLNLHDILGATQTQPEQMLPPEQVPQRGGGGVSAPALGQEIMAPEATTI
jgi:hypothetical protein